MFALILSPVTVRQHASQFGFQFNSSGCILSDFNLGVLSWHTEAI